MGEKCLTVNMAAVTSRVNQQYSQVSLTRTPLGLAPSAGKCPSQRDVRLIESQIKGVKKDRDQL